MQPLTFGGDVAAELEDELVSFAHGELGRGLREAAVASGSQFGQLPAQVSAGQGRHQDGIRLVRTPLEDEGDGVAARRLLQLLCQGGEVAGLQRGEETQHQQPAEVIQPGEKRVRYRPENGLNAFSLHLYHPLKRLFWIGEFNHNEEKSLVSAGSSCLLFFSGHRKS